ncbi:hypothetical protein [Thalassospira lohafexi]|uniref:Uncharacterized protein n=1 Tax=Thalassospira lohafexi TaxID=744227 RepID=A0A2N3L249_9PROT|nr:hypothetical protein [Thalassospira lohafexi]PKR56882.1 hypothetical protein COO92_17995 [Thalassospira lohafexi]
MSSAAPTNQLDQKDQATDNEGRPEFERGLWHQSFKDAIGMAQLLLSAGFVVALLQLAKYLKLLAGIGDPDGLVLEGLTFSIWIIVGYIVLRNVLAHYIGPEMLPEIRRSTVALYFGMTTAILLISSIPSMLLYYFMFPGIVHSIQHLAMAGVGGGGLLFGVQFIAGVAFLISFALCAGVAGTLLPQLVLERRVSLRCFMRRAFDSFGYVLVAVAGSFIGCAVLKFAAAILTIWFMTWTPEYRPFGLNIAWQGFLGANLQLFFTALMIVLVMNAVVRAYVTGEQHLATANQKVESTSFSSQ